VKTFVWSLVPAVALLAGCNNQPAEPEKPAQTFHEVMKDEVDVQADVVWEVGNKAMNDIAEIDPAKMTDADWDRMAQGADALRAAALKIATMDPLIIAPPGVKIADEGLPYGHTAAMVQERFDKDPETLRNLARTLADHVGGIADAARAHDPAKASPLINQLDGVCEDCHLEYWYPDQKDLVEQYRDKPE
jgi:hypothetical protein